jgi:hypothetical protein
MGVLIVGALLLTLGGASESREIRNTWEAAVNKADLIVAIVGYCSSPAYCISSLLILRLSIVQRYCWARFQETVSRCIASTDPKVRGLYGPHPSASPKASRQLTLLALTPACPTGTPSPPTKLPTTTSSVRSRRLWRAASIASSSPATVRRLHRPRHFEQPPAWPHPGPRVGVPGRQHLRRILFGRRGSSPPSRLRLNGLLVRSRRRGPLHLRAPPRDGKFAMHAPSPPFAPIRV